MAGGLGHVLSYKLRHFSTSFGKKPHIVMADDYPRNGYGLRYQGLDQDLCTSPPIRFKGSKITDGAFKEKEAQAAKHNLFADNHSRAVRKLRDKTRRLQEELDLQHFLTMSIDRMTNRMAWLIETPTAKTPLESPAGLPKPPEENIAQLALIQYDTFPAETRLADIESSNHSLVQSLLRVIAYVLQLQSEGPRKGQVHSSRQTSSYPAHPLFRFHKRSGHKGFSASLHYQDIGIRYPGWRKYESCDREISKEHVRKHLEGFISSPPFISASESPGRLLKLMKYEETCRFTTIFVISPLALERLNVELYRSTDLKSEFRLVNVRYATHITGWFIDGYLENALSVGFPLKIFERFAQTKE